MTCRNCAEMEEAYNRNWNKLDDDFQILERELRRLQKRTELLTDALERCVAKLKTEGLQQGLPYQWAEVERAEDILKEDDSAGSPD